MIRLLMWLLLIYIGYRVITSLVSRKKPDSIRKDQSADSAATTHRDPVCGMYISEEEAVVGKVNDQRHYFCSMACLDKFRDQLNQTHK